MALIKCSECGKDVSEKATFCPNCGNPVNSTTQVERKPTNEEQSGEYLCCPKCSSKELHAEKSGFSGSKALAGVVVAGGIGLLAGTIGSRDVKITCLKCGNKFNAGDAKIVKLGVTADSLEKRIINLLCDMKEVEAQQLFEKEMNIKSGLLPSSEWTDYRYKLADRVQQSMTEAQKEQVKKHYEGLKNKKGCLSVIVLLIVSSVTLFSQM